MPGQSDLVINTGPVLALAAAGHLYILRELFATVTVPYEVVQEIEAGGRTQFAREEFRAASWLDKRDREHFSITTPSVHIGSGGSSCRRARNV